MNAPVPQSGILDIKPYVGGVSDVRGATRIIKLSSNETPIGPSPRAIEAYRAAAEKIGRYPDGESQSLRQALATHYDIDVDRVICGNGSDELIGLLAQAYVGPGDEVIYSQYGFLMYPIAAKANGAKPIAVPEKNQTADIDAILKAVTPRTRLVFLANPNNPTGTYLSNSEVERLCAALPSNIVLVIDAAYAEYVNRNDYTPGFDLVQQYPNVVMTRTFSKIYGLAGLRVGWAYASQDICHVLNRIRGAFNVNLPAQAAAIAALADIAHVDAARTHNDIWLPWLSLELGKLGLQVTPSVGNFILVKFGTAPKDSKSANAFLMARGLILRAMEAYHLPDSLRITIGTEEENRLLLQAIMEFLAL